MPMKVLVAIAIALLLLGVGKIYLEDSASVDQARVVLVYIKDHCRAHNAYPEFEEVEQQFPKLFPGREWYYWPNETLTAGTIQYPMTLPIPGAPGHSKFSEFLPVIYAYTIRHPCDGLTREVPEDSGR